ncbi:MAG: hypothetical protein KAX18_10810 [Candidatus Lokiarchaeota archaeon]|jgi:hypothetical protein|nr:hypothetical protein [Candidatus Lokiarchaeota archaeon]
MSNSKEEDFESFIKSDIIHKIKKVRGKHPPIAENVENKPRSLSVKSIYDLNENLKNFYFITLKNYSKKPKFRYFLVISFANHSSDLLVQLASKIVLKHHLKLIQYSIYPKTLRIHLLCMKEIQKIKDYENSINVLKLIRKEFREKLVRLKNLVENE